jgi:hypothetical protein
LLFGYSSVVSITPALRSSIGLCYVLALHTPWQNPLIGGGVAEWLKAAVC